MESNDEQSDLRRDNMDAMNFVFTNTFRELIRRGYTENQSVHVADHILTLYKQNQLEKPTRFTAEAVRYAEQHYGKPRGQ